MTSERADQCATCNGRGWIGGPSYREPDEGGVQCPDCNAVEQHTDPAHPFNGEMYHSGKLCIEGCGRPAGTAWSPYWCQQCNSERLSGINTSLIAMQTNLRERAP